jgi:hypothetical protein
MQNVDLLGPTPPHLSDRQLGTVSVLRRNQLRALTESANQLLERSGLRFCLTRLVTGAQDCQSWGFEIWSDVPLQEIYESNEGEKPSCPGDGLWP